MTSNTIISTYKNHSFYRNRLETDTFFSLPFGSVSMKGALDSAIRLTEELQLTDASLWARFVTQFKNTAPKADDADDGWRGEYWGKMMRGACFVYQYTKNSALYDILCATVCDMINTADENGRISSYSVDHQYNGWDMWCRKYVILGMQYFIEICIDKDMISKITDCLKKQVDYLIQTVGYESEGKTHITRTSEHWHGMNSSSILEPIVRMYNLTGEQKYLDFASYIVDSGVIYDEDVNLFDMAYKDELPLHKYPVTKAYEMMSCFEGLIEYYRVTGIEKWKTAAINFANRVRNEEISVIGSAGCTHELFDNTIARQTNTTYNGMLQETCVTVTWVKLCYQLLCLTGNSVYADEMEKSLLNAYLGAINYNKNAENGGLPFDSYSPLLFNNRAIGIGGHKIMADGSYYGCCACIGSAGAGLIEMSSAMLTDDGIAINTYTNEKINYITPNGEKLSLKITTDYPVDDVINVEFLSDNEGESQIMLRIPEWSAKSFASINGESVTVKCGTYAKFKKAWKKGDYITLKFDMRARVIKALGDPDDKNSVYHVAIKRGPIMLARDSRLQGNIENIVELAPDKNGYVECELQNMSKKDFAQIYNIIDANGLAIPMIEYASAGRTWNDDSVTTVWLPTKDYWSFDFTKPIYLTAPNMWGMTAGRYPLALNSDKLLTIEDEGNIGNQFHLWSTGENRFFIRVVSSGLYLALTDDEKNVTVAEKGVEFSLVKHAQNRYRIVAPNGLDLVGAEDMKNPIITLASPSCEAIHIFRIEQ